MNNPLLQSVQLALHNGAQGLWGKHQIQLMYLLRFYANLK
jgi:hypothetical protein